MYIKRNIGLHTIGVDEFSQVDPCGPVRRHSERVGRLPIRFNEVSLCIDVTGVAAHQTMVDWIVVSLGMSSQKCLGGHKSSTQAAIPAQPIDLESIAGSLCLRAHIEDQLLPRRH